MNTIFCMSLLSSVREWRSRRAQRKIAGLKARYGAVRELVNGCTREVPANLLLELVELPQHIAETDQLITQLDAKGTT